MSGIEIGRICIKTKGREAGRKVVVVGTEKNYAIVDGPEVKKRKCNMLHLMPLKEKLKIDKNVSKVELKKLLKN